MSTAYKHVLAVFDNGECLSYSDVDSVIERFEEYEDVAYILTIDDKGAAVIWHPAEPDGEMWPVDLNEPGLAKEVAVGLVHILTGAHRDRQRQEPAS